MNKFNCYIVYQNDSRLDIEHFYGNAWLLKQRIELMNTTQVEVIRGHQRLARFTENEMGSAVALWEDIPNTGS
jgi:hypothetical protein